MKTTSQTCARALSLSIGVAMIAGAGCAKMVASYNRYVQQQIVDYGEWELDVESQLGGGGISGTVYADGCAQIDSTEATTYQVQGNQVATQQGGTEESCQRWPVSGALVRVLVGGVEVSRRTDVSGHFVIASGSELARLTGAGDTGTVSAEYYGREATGMLRFGALNDVAALRLLDEMDNVTVRSLAGFVDDWQGTDAASLALERYGYVACDAFQADWSHMLATGDMASVNDISDVYNREWQNRFCSTCASECQVMESLGDLSSELGSLGR